MPCWLPFFIFYITYDWLYRSLNEISQLRAPPRGQLEDRGVENVRILKCFNVLMLECMSVSMIECMSASMVECMSVSMIECMSVSMIECFVPCCCCVSDKHPQRPRT